MGVDEDRFWNMTPKSLDPYYKAFSIKAKREDEAMWMNGIYMSMAIGSVLSGEVDYPKRPLMAQQELDMDKELLAERKMELIKQRMMEQMFVINRDLKKKGG